MTYMFILKCALKLVEELILYYDARSKSHQITKGQCSLTQPFVYKTNCFVL